MLRPTSLRFDPPLNWRSRPRKSLKYEFPNCPLAPVATHPHTWWLCFVRRRLALAMSQTIFVLFFVRPRHWRLKWIVRCPNVRSKRKNVSNECKPPTIHAWDQRLRLKIWTQWYLNQNLRHQWIPFARFHGPFVWNVFDPLGSNNQLNFYHCLNHAVLWYEHLLAFVHVWNTRHPFRPLGRRPKRVNPKQSTTNDNMPPMWWGRHGLKIQWLLLWCETMFLNNAIVNWSIAKQHRAIDTVLLNNWAKW